MKSPLPRKKTKQKQNNLHDGSFRCSNYTVRLVIRIIRVIGKLPDNNVAHIAPEIGLRRLKLQLANLVLLPKRIDRADIAVVVVDAHLVHRLATRVLFHVVQRHELDPRMGGREDRVREVARVGDVVHAQVQPDDEVRLGQVLRVEEVVKVDGRVVHVLGVVGVCGARLVVVLLGDLDVVAGPVCCVDQVRRVLDREVDCALRGQDAVAPVFAVLVLLIHVDHAELGCCIRAPVQTARVFAFDDATLQLHRVARLVARPGESLRYWDGSC